MKKAIFIFMMVSISFVNISHGRTYSEKNLNFLFSIISCSTSFNTNTECTPVRFSDSLCQIIIKVYQKANKTYIENNLPVALELYGQFIDLSISHNYEKYFWQEIRMSLSHMSSINFTFLNYEKSIHYLKKALEITFKYNPNDFENTFHFLFNIAKSYYNQNDYTNSLEYYHQAEALIISTNSLQIINKAQLYNNLALCYYKLGKDFESQNYLNESIRIKIFLGDFDNLASNYNNIGLVFQKKEQYNEALFYFHKSLFLYDSLKNLGRLAFVINNIGNLYLEKGSYDSSKFFYKKSLSIRKNKVVTNSSDLIISYNNLSFVYYKLNELDSALIFNNLAIDLNNQYLEANDDNRYFSISEYLVSIADRIDINLSKYNATSNENYLIESFSLFQPTVKLIIDQLIRYNSIFSTNIFVNENKRFFDSSIRSSLLLDSLILTKCPRSLIISETFKSLSLINIRSEIRTLQYDSISFKQFGQLNKYYQWQQDLLQKERSATGMPKMTIIDSLINSTLDLDLHQAQFLAMLKINLYNYFDNLSDSISAYCDNLDDKLLLDYYIFNNAICIHAISKSNILTFVSPTTKEFSSAVQNYLKSIKSLEQGSTLFFSKALSINLITPIYQIVELFNRITIIPDQYLIEIPFESLPYSQGKFSQKQYLVEYKYISYRFSLLTRNYSKINLSNKYSEDFFGLAPFKQKDSSFHNLNSSAREIVDISNLFKTKKLTASYLIGNSATYNNFTNSNFDARILHLSTHSFIDNQNSQLSFLELFTVNNKDNLFLPVLSSIPFRNELLLLNACETGNNLIDPGTGFVSFIRSISNISIQNYMCTIWKIFDEPSYLFIMKFYGNVLKGYSYDQALTLAKRQFLRSDIYSYPLFWSPFILYENN